ncbi:monoglyceride lipase [Patella vulgata]|uniref:monoglyceride lipase n=1 Tax=Patella vulgata TaxID=6465 RepID=UPI0021806AC3|nr:monoglyceride lipase [Patella vulgata]
MAQTKYEVSEEKTSEKWMTNADNQSIFCRYWGDDAGITKPSGLVFIAHGAAEHCLWYGELASQLIQKNLYVFAHDHIGHGQSEGARVHIDDFDYYVRDVFQHIEDVQKKFDADIPCFIIGHSMGGAISIMAAMKRPTFFKGVVLIAPAIIPSPDAVSPLKIHVGRVVARLCPQCPVVYLDQDKISRDTAVVKKYSDDPLVHHGGLKAKWGLCMINTLKYIEDHLTDITWPFLNLHGEEDKIVDVQGSREMDEKAQSKDKTLKIYPKHYHQLHNEPGSDGAKVREDIINWITERL